MRVTTVSPEIPRSLAGLGRQFASVILVKRNFVEVLRQELTGLLDVLAGGARHRHRPLQPVEGHYKLTRGTIEALTFPHSHRHRHQGPMIVRD